MVNINKRTAIYMKKQVSWKESSEIGQKVELLRLFCEDNGIMITGEGALHISLHTEDGNEKQYGKLVDADTFEPLYAWPNGIEYKLLAPEVKEN